ncbi:putative Leucine-rich receptor-like kinase family protein [Melia azedarach]|uniref:Leucine-rich receptor-like kinase family protein n=1 Tax=Melia azedarach TaxID=155640 RepID=A0ACC1Y5D7_MELAZ|nr:putative Leucine-rich receptor-like kinase family protein [Melia azedarach]
MNLTNLQWLYLNNKNFSGKIEDGLLKASLLLALDLCNNEFSGQIPSWIGNILNLEYLVLANNFLEGNIPTQLGNLEFLQILDIFENRLARSISSSFNLSSLQNLYMHKNAFNGSILDAFRRSSRLITLDIRDNKFSRTIPNWINEDSRLHILLLSGHNLQGHFPYQVCELNELSIADVLYNKFSGSIPPCYTNMTIWNQEHDVSLFKLTEEQSFDMSENYYNSILPLNKFEEDDDRPSFQREIELMTKNRYESYKGNILNYMAGLDLFCNEFTGDIPPEYGSFPEIHALNFSHNFFSGSIPESFSNLKMIESLDLSDKKLSGSIPPQLTKLNFLSNFNVSYNNLSGPTPNVGQFVNFDESNYRGNLGLCGPTISKKCISVLDSPEKPSSEGEENESTIDMVAFYWSFAASFVIYGIILKFLHLFINFHIGRHDFDLNVYVQFIPD